ncbi:hypothetical protein QYF36_003218 [Acer negundo]|nr:hypothetical protein QYF36_003218 [Acer negundo]
MEQTPPLMEPLHLLGLPPSLNQPPPPPSPDDVKLPLVTIASGFPSLDNGDSWRKEFQRRKATSHANIVFKRKIAYMNAKPKNARGASLANGKAWRALEVAMSLTAR